MYFRSGIYNAGAAAVATGTDCLSEVGCTDDDTSFLGCGYNIIPVTTVVSVICQYGMILSALVALRTSSVVIVH